MIKRTRTIVTCKHVAQLNWLAWTRVSVPSGRRNTATTWPSSEESPPAGDCWDWDNHLHGLRTLSLSLSQSARVVPHTPPHLSILPKELLINGREWAAERINDWLAERHINSSNHRQRREDAMMGCVCVCVKQQRRNKSTKTSLKINKRRNYLHLQQFHEWENFLSLSGPVHSLAWSLHASTVTHSKYSEPASMGFRNVSQGDVEPWVTSPSMPTRKP